MFILLILGTKCDPRDPDRNRVRSGSRGGTWPQGKEGPPWAASTAGWPAGHSQCGLYTEQGRGTTAWPASGPNLEGMEQL